MDDPICECDHPLSVHGKLIPEQPPSGSHTCVCSSNVNMDGTPSGLPCDCGGDRPQPEHFDPGCFDTTSRPLCGCPEFQAKESKP